MIPAVVAGSSGEFVTMSPMLRPRRWAVTALLPVPALPTQMSPGSFVGQLAGAPAVSLYSFVSLVMTTTIPIEATSD
jgi:hypothetical protein